MSERGGRWGAYAAWLMAGLALAACDDGAPVRDGGSSAACVTAEDCSDGRFCNGEERCVGVGATADADARGCAPAESAACDATMYECFELESRCRTRCDITFDADGDGYDAMDCGGADCDDADAERYPGNVELCDFVGHDEDCDLETYGLDRDIDGDGAVDANCFNTGGTARGTDCDDRRAFVAPDQEESCNGLDDDCDGMVDEAVTVARYVDRDGDGDGEAMSGAVQVCASASGYAATATDCDDTSALFRGAPWFELCDGSDNDCDGTVDENPTAVPWYVDADGDGFGDGHAAIVISCAIVPGRSILGSDCDDAMARVRPGNPELCNGLDDDCNGALDFRDVDYAEDEDSDGIPNVRCHPAGDCDDRDFFSGGDAPEVCGDRVDNDCDGMVDEAGAVAIDWYPDVDGDGWGDELGTAVSRCERVPRASFRVHDCDDSDPLRHPMAVDGCDGVDEDCDVAIDEDAAVHAVFRDLDGDGAGVDADLLLVCAAGAPAGYAATPSDCAPLDPSIGVRWADADGDGIGGGEPLTMCSVGTFATVGGDCDDGDAMVSSGCQELCNGVDDDGDGAIDETGASGCPHASGTSWTCMPGGTCAFGGCASGSANCDAIVSNGCESDLDTDAVNCGGCGMSCGAGADCVARSCTGTVIDVAVADQKSCALRDNGTVVCWGELPYDLGGYAGAPSVSTRMREMGAPMADATFIEVGPVVWCAGRSGDGLLHCSADLSDVYGVAGHGAPNVRPMGPTLVGGITEMGSYTWHACAVGPGGTVLCWGWNNEGVLGRGFASGAELLPDVVGGITGATAVCTGLVHSCALTPSGVLCWGRTSQEAFGTFGGSSPALFPVPVALSDLGTDPVIDIACGYINTCVLRASGRIDCSGQILPGPGFMNMTQIGTVPGGTEIAATDYSYCVASPTGAYCFGRDTHGVLGNGPGTDSMTPTAAIGLGAVTHVDVSTDHACAVTPAGEVWCWGDNNVGQVGAASTRSEVPLRVLNLP